MAQKNCRYSYGQDGVAARGLVNGRDPRHVCVGGIYRLDRNCTDNSGCHIFADKHLKYNL